MNSLGRKVLFREALAPLERRYEGNERKMKALQAFRDRVIVDGAQFRASIEHPVISTRYWWNETKLFAKAVTKRDLNGLINLTAASELPFDDNKIFRIAVDRCISRTKLVFAAVLGLAVGLEHFKTESEPSQQLALLTYFATLSICLHIALYTGRNLINSRIGQFTGES